MTNKELELYVAYVFNRRAQLEEDIHELQNNVRWRLIDYIDLLELLIALVKLDTFNEITGSLDVLFGLRPALRRRFRHDKNNF